MGLLKMEEVPSEKDMSNFCRDFEQVFIEVANKIQPSIVKVNTMRIVLTEKGMSSETGSASGVILTKEGHIITSHHVINDKSFVQIVLHDGTTLNGEVLGFSKIKDLALVKVDYDGLVPIDFAPYDNPKVGQFVMVAGNPIGIGISMAFGMVSAIDRVLEFGGQFLDSLIQTTAPINVGNSGGALVDTYGRLVGIATATINQIQGISFAVSACEVKKLLFEYLEYGEIGTPWLGVGGVTVDDFISRRYGFPMKEGVVVILSKGPALEGNIQLGDVIIKINEHTISDTVTLRQIINSYRTGNEILLTLYRYDDGYIERKVKLGTMGL